MAVIYEKEVNFVVIRKERKAGDEMAFCFGTNDPLHQAQKRALNKTISPLSNLLSFM